MPTTVDQPTPRPSTAATVPPRPTARRRRRRDPRVLLGTALVVAGLAAAGIAVWATLVDEGPLPVGRLVAADIAPPVAGGAGEGGSPGAAPDGPPAWPGPVQGRPPAFGADGDDPPASAEGLADGWYLWSDFTGWHLWLVGDVGGSVEVTTNGTFLADVTGGSPSLELADDRLVLQRGSAEEPVVGVDFNPGFFANELTVTVTGDGPLRTGFGLADAESPLVLSYRPQG